jgi:hypothetical protein
MSRILSWRRQLPVIPLDLVYLLAPILGLIHPALGLCLLLGLGGLAILALRLGRLQAAEAAYPPSWWFLPAVVIPWSTLAALESGIWRDTGAYRKGFALGSTILIAALLLVFVSGTYRPLLNPVLQPLEDYGEEYIVHTQLHTGAAYAGSRAMNALLSTAMSVETNAKLFGSGFGARLGRTLEPIDDLVERFSTVMLINLATLTGILFVGKLGKAIALTLMLPASLVLFLIALWSPQGRNLARFIALRLLVAALVFRFIVPVTGFFILGVDQAVLKKEQNAAQSNLSEFGFTKPAGTGEDRIRSDIPPETSWFNFDLDQKFKELKAQIDSIRNSLSNIVDSIVTLIVVFTVKALLIPLIVLYFSLRLLRWLFGRERLGASWEDALKDRFTRPVGPSGEPARSSAQ